MWGCLNEHSRQVKATVEKQVTTTVENSSNIWLIKTESFIRALQGFPHFHTAVTVSESFQSQTEFVLFYCFKFIFVYSSVIFAGFSIKFKFKVKKDTSVECENVEARQQRSGQCEAPIYETSA